MYLRSRVIGNKEKVKMEVTAEDELSEEEAMEAVKRSSKLEMIAYQVDKDVLAYWTGDKEMFVVKDKNEEDLYRQVKGKGVGATVDARAKDMMRGA